MINGGGFDRQGLDYMGSGSGEGRRTEGPDCSSKRAIGHVPSQDCSHRLGKKRWGGKMKTMKKEMLNW
ncbi:unnamed protein product [Victoria cruziana]